MVRLFGIFALVLVAFACEWKFGDVYVLFLLRCGEQLHVGCAISVRHVASWACVGEKRSVRRLVLEEADVVGALAFGGWSSKK